MNSMQPALTDAQLNVIYSQSDKMTAQEIGKSVGLKARTVSVACGKMGVRPLRHSLKFVPKPRVTAN
jgi:predicted amidohydrolase